MTQHASHQVHVYVEFVFVLNSYLFQHQHSALFDNVWVKQTA